MTMLRDLDLSSDLKNASHNIAFLHLIHNKTSSKKKEKCPKTDLDVVKNYLSR